MVNKDGNYVTKALVENMPTASFLIQEMSKLQVLTVFAKPLSRYLFNQDLQIVHPLLNVPFGFTTAHHSSDYARHTDYFGRTGQMIHAMNFETFINTKDCFGRGSQFYNSLKDVFAVWGEVEEDVDLKELLDEFM